MRCSARLAAGCSLTPADQVTRIYADALVECIGPSIASYSRASTPATGPALRPGVRRLGLSARVSLRILLNAEQLDEDLQCLILPSYGDAPVGIRGPQAGL